MTRSSSSSSPVAVVDVGGTDTKTGVTLPDGTLTRTATSPTPREDAVAGVVELAAGHVERLRPEVGALGLVVPGIVDDDAGTAVLSANLGWRDVPFAALLAERTGLPVALGHDVTAAGLAELRQGAARGARDAAVLVLGTGMAAALFSDGRPVRGGGYAGEVGHAPALAGDEACSCGGRGCPETVAGARAILRRYAARSGRTLPGVREVLAAAHGGDEDARAVWAEATDAIALVVAQLAATLAPETVVLGGGLSRAGAALLDPVRDRLGQLLVVHRVPELRLGVLGADAGLVGAGILAKEAAR